MIQTKNQKIPINLKMNKHKNKIYYIRLVFILLFFYFLPIIILTKFIDDFFYIIFLGLGIGFLSTSDNIIFSISDKNHLILSSLSLLNFYIFSMVFKYDLIGVFLYSTIVSFSVLYFKFNKLSLRRNKKKIDFVGGPGFNIKSTNTTLGILFTLSIFILALIYFVIYILYIEMS